MIGPEERWRRHVPRQTSYRCRACGDDWPCQEARLALLTGFRGDRVGLMVYLGGHLARALQQLPDVHPALLTTRFLHWVPRRR
ncbi:flavin reductase [Micromonospora sp. WMMD1102]|uniref:flavin reductase n=1 Tax=Micromonospora sp. WMMD1102 TaxID=3016105 RepID=UPI002414E930|nr:flavin reductase [Micromonospora sp. WMMD1102]MDG4789472.1 flavin reductase [Micromonospora sp. WMMD1102]